MIISYSNPIYFGFFSRQEHLKWYRMNPLRQSLEDSVGELTRKTMQEAEEADGPMAIRKFEEKKNVVNLMMNHIISHKKKTIWGYNE